MSTPSNHPSLFPASSEEIASRIDADVANLLYGRSGGPLGLTLDPNDKKVLEMIRYRRGRQNAVSIRSIESRTGLSPRSVKLAVQTLRMNFRLPIGSSKDSERGGYFLMVTAEDIAAWKSDVLDQVKAELEVLRAAAGDQVALELVGQLRAELTT